MQALVQKRDELFNRNPRFAVLNMPHQIEDLTHTTL
jgi:hypothetical protein